MQLSLHKQPQPVPLALRALHSAQELVSFVKFINTLPLSRSLNPTC